MNLIKRPNTKRWLTFIACLFVGAGVAHSQAFRMPTANRSLFNPNAQDQFFCGTIGRTWHSGGFGCVRSGGWQMHEGIDIRSIQRDQNGEATDRVFATADGTVVYVNTKPSLSNYGNYVILKHQINGLDIYSLYAHLSQVRPGLKAGQTFKAGDIIAMMGRTTNTREKISKDRAHLHFELNLFVTERFGGWFKKHFTQRNDHGLWNGQNMIGLDPRLMLLASHKEGQQFNLVRWIQQSPELCRVQVRDTDFPWLKRYAALVDRPANGQKVAGYELVLNFNGLPIRAIPKSAQELKSKSKCYLVSVNAAEYKKSPCRKLVTQKNGKFQLGENGLRLLELLTY